MSSQLPAGSLTRTEEMRCGAGGPTSGEEGKQQQQQQQLRVNNPGCDTETEHQCGSGDKNNIYYSFLLNGKIWIICSHLLIGTR